MLALGCATFAFVTTENLPVGLLPLIAHDLHRSRSAVGLLMTAYAFTVVVMSVPLTFATRRLPRRRLLVGVLSLFVVATSLGAAAPSYALLLGSRMAIALAHAVYWSVVARTAAGLVQPSLRGRALGIVYAGASLSSVAGLPAATWLGQHTSWRVATLAAAALGLAALAVVAALLPGDGVAEIASDVGRHADPRRYTTLLVALALAVTGIFATLTYVSPFLTSVAGFPQRDVGPILFVQGAAGVAGVWLASRHVTRRPRAVLVGGVAVVCCAMLALAAAGHVQAAVVALLAVYGSGFSALVVGGQNRLLDVVPGNPDVASAGYSATFNIGIGGGALVGGLLLPSAGVRSTPLVGGLLAAAALAVLLAEPVLATRGSHGRHARA